MALKPTIYKWKIDLTDLDREHYDNLNLTVAQHPSENIERMVARVLVYCINAAENLEFTRGISEANEPDLWKKSLSDSIELWIEVGEPSIDRIKKSTRVAETVRVYAFNTKSDTWWSQIREPVRTLNAEVFQIEWGPMVELAGLVKRTMAAAVTISEQTAYFSTPEGDVAVSWSEMT